MQVMKSIAPGHGRYGQTHNPVAIAVYSIIAVVIGMLCSPALAATPVLPSLCDQIPGPNGTVAIQCAIDTGNFSSAAPLVPAAVRLLEYNIDENGRGGDGLHEDGLQPIIELLLTGNNGSIPIDNDFIVLSEVKRGCKSSNYVNGAQKLAASLSMNFMFVVEYIDRSDSDGTTECTIGNAILSKYTFHHYAQLRYTHQCCTYSDHVGGRIAGLGQWMTTTGGLLSIITTHLESGTYSIQNVLESLIVRAEQSKEAGAWVLQQSSTRQDHILIVAGDFNAPFQDFDPTLLALRNESFHDAHAALPWAQRVTCPDDKTLMELGLGTLDYIVGFPRDVFSSPGVASSAGGARGWSDHVPIWASMNLTVPMAPASGIADN